MRYRSIIGIYALSLRVWAIALFSMIESVFQIERYIYALSLDYWDICAIARFWGNRAFFNVRTRISN